MANLEIDDILQSQTISGLELWLTYSFAPEWLADAKAEAGKPAGQIGARRREIIFAVAFAESYLVEWVRDEILQKNYNKFFEIFPMSEKLSAEDKWKKVPKTLLKQGLLKASPSLNCKFWQDYLTLVQYRNGLIHAVSSSPRGVLPEEAPPLPSLATLANLKPGWAIQIVISLVSAFHEAAGTNLPAWLNEK